MLMNELLNWKKGWIFYVWERICRFLRKWHCPVVYNPVPVTILVLGRIWLRFWRRSQIRNNAWYMWRKEAEEPSFICGIFYWIEAGCDVPWVFYGTIIGYRCLLINSWNWAIIVFRFIIYLCPGGLTDKVVDSGSTDTGSIPVRDAKKRAPGF